MKLNVLAYNIIARPITWKCYGILGMQQNENHELVKKVKAQVWTGPWGFRRLRFPEFMDIRHTKLSALCTGRHYPPQESIPRTLVRPKECSQWKIPMTRPRSEPATFRLLAQCLNHLRRHVPGLATCMKQKEGRDWFRNLGKSHKISGKTWASRKFRSMEYLDLHCR